MEIEAMNCPICSCTDSRIFASWPDYDVQECCDCRFRFVDTSRPGYPEQAQYVYDELKIGAIRPDSPHIQRRVRDVVSFRSPPGKALDVGCGKGEVALALEAIGFQSLGIDMKPRLIEHLQSRFPHVGWRCAMSNELNDLNERFDVITMYHVLEHIPDPLSALSTIKSLANPGALIVLEVPNVDGWKARLKGRRWEYYKVDHVNYFRPKDLRALGRRLDLTLVGLRGYQHFSYPQQIWWKDRVKGTLANLGFKNVFSVFFKVA